MGLYTALCNMNKYNREYYFSNHTFTIGEVEDCIEDMGKKKEILKMLQICLILGGVLVVMMMSKTNCQKDTLIGVFLVYYSYIFGKIITQKYFITKLHL